MCISHQNQPYPFSASATPSKSTSCGSIEDLISWEQEERARNLRESGLLGLYPLYDHKGRGKGTDSQINQAIMGASKAIYDASLAYEYPIPESGPQVFRKRCSYLDKPGGRRLTASQFVDLYSAVAFANSLGLVLNAHISITWGQLGITDQTEAAKVLRNGVLKDLKAWLHYKTKGQRLVWLYVHEVGKKHGFHTHLLIAMPQALRKEFRQWLAQRLSAVCHPRSMPKTAYKIVAPPSDRIGRQWLYFQYLMKGIHGDEMLSSTIGHRSHIPVGDLIRPSLENPGEVLCKKKCGVSNLIGVKARQRAGFRSLVEQGVLDVRRIYVGMEYLSFLKQSDLDMNDPAVRGLLKGEEHVLALEEEDLVSSRHNRVLRRQDRSARRQELKADHDRQAQWLKLDAEKKELTERLKWVFRK